MKTLDIRVAFSAVDRLTRPTENARRMMGQLGDSIQRTQGAIKNLERHARSFDRAREAANKAGNGIVRAQRQLSALQQIQRAGTVLSDKQKKLMNDLSLKLERLNEVRAREVQRMRELGGELRRHGIALSGSDNTIQQAIRRTQQYNDQLERERQALARVTQARQQYSRAQETAGKLKTVGLTAVGTAAAGGYAAGRFLQPAVSFGKEMSRVQALTRIDKNSPQFKALREQAIKLGSETQFTAGDAASGQAFLAMAGFTPQAIQAALPGVLDLAMAAGMDLGQTADISSNILTQFGLSADQMDRVGDTLAATFTRTNTDLRSLGETMKYTGPVAASLGLSLEQAAAMTGVLGSVGIRGSDAGTALRASLSRLVDPPKAAAMALKELGVETQDAYGNMRRMENILNELYQATRKYGNAAQVSFFRAIAGQESYVSLMNLVTAAGENNLPRLTQEIELATGELNHTARVMADNLDGDLKSLNSAWEGLRIRVADLVDGPLRSVTQSFTRVIAKVTALAQAHPELTKQLLIAGGVLLAAVAANRAVIILACPFKNFITYAFKFCGECLGCQCGDALDFVTGELRQCEQFFKAMAHDGGFECRRCKAVVNPFNTFQARTQSTANEIIGHVCAVVFYTFTAGTLLFPVQSCQITDQHTGKKRGQGAKFGYRLRYRRWRIFASVSCQLIQPYLPLFVPVKV